MSFPFACADVWKQSLELSGIALGSYAFGLDS